MKPPRQKSLFDTSPDPWEADSDREQTVATIVIPDGPPDPLHYSIPEEILPRLAVGKRVVVPLGKGNRQATGYCIEILTQPVSLRRLKPIQEVIDAVSLVTPHVLRLTAWIAEYYLTPWGQVLDAVVPQAIRNDAGLRATTFYMLAKDAAERIEEFKLNTKQKQVVRVLMQAEQGLTSGQLVSMARCSLSSLNTLRKKGIVVTQSRRIRSREFQPPQPSESQWHALNADQQRAFDAIQHALAQGKHETILLHGITGSGKTEVYMQAVREVIRFGRQAIILVPEISLTPQTRERFRGHFGNVAVLHSHQSNAERHWHWEQISQGKVHVVVGARSAIFAPVPHLGLIVLDEEHETSFKQDSAPRYHARDVALWRAKDLNIPLVLGTATPSIESWFHANSGKYQLATLPRRVMQLELPRVQAIDLRNIWQGTGSRSAISPPLAHSMDRELAAGGQVILLLNRRGYSTHVQCSACGFVVKCPDCDIALTHHRHTESALCHYCDYEIPSPSRCPSCKQGGLNYRGLGTQKLEAEVRARFPNYPALRMDSDTMVGQNSHEKALERFQQGEIRILLGTQMIAKGLDFPNVTLVGVVYADLTLHMPDFRAAERTVQLLVQVAGRAGRGEKGGAVYIQTLTPDHPAIAAACQHDFRKFADTEIELRRDFQYPPFSQLARIVVRGENAKTAEEFANTAADSLRKSLADLGPEARVLGAAEAPFAKLRGMSRFHIQVHTGSPGVVQPYLKELTTKLEPPEGVQWIVDIDPLDML